MNQDQKDQVTSASDGRQVIKEIPKAHRYRMPGQLAFKSHLTVEEAAEVLGISRKAIYAGLDSRTIPGVVRPTPKTIRFHRDTLLAWGSEEPDRGSRKRGAK